MCKKNNYISATGQNLWVPYFSIAYIQLGNLNFTRCCFDVQPQTILRSKNPTWYMPRCPTIFFPFYTFRRINNMRWCYVGGIVFMQYVYLCCPKSFLLHITCAYRYPSLDLSSAYIQIVHKFYNTKHNIIFAKVFFIVCVCVILAYVTFSTLNWEKWKQQRL